MNILPFVSILILVISLTISSFFHGYKETSFLKLGSLGTINAHRLARNSSEETRLASYKKTLPEEVVNKTPRKPRNTKKNSPQSFREKITDNSKLNLLPLIREDLPLLEPVFARLLEEIYAHTNLFQEYKYEKENLSTLLAKSILQTAKTIPVDKLFAFEDIVLPQKELHDLWYKMLKGTPDYPSLGGWPPISQFVLLKETKKPSVLSGRKASIPLLKAFFGEEITTAILAKEKEENRTRATITTAELTTLLNAFGFPPHLRSYIHHGYGSSLHCTEVEKDPKTGITANISYTTKRPI